MPETKVDTTLREVIGDSVQTREKSEDKDSQQTKSGDKREFISGIDVSDIPDNMTKQEFKDFLAKKGKLLEDGYTPKFKQVAEYVKEKESLTALGVTPQEASKIIREAIAARDNKSKTDVKQDIKREIDQLKDEAPDLETRKGVERLERIIMELSKSSPEYKELKERLDRAEKALGYVQNKTITSRVESLNEALDKLSGEKFDKDFIEKYREKAIEEGKKYPDAPLSKILQVITDPDDYDSALLKTKKKEEVKESRIKEKINANDSASSGVTGKEKDIDVKSMSLKQVIRHAFSQKK
jgi:tetrahydromethanopterin S-methyltransferase subunit G